MQNELLIWTYLPDLPLFRLNSAFLSRANFLTSRKVFRSTGSGAQRMMHSVFPFLQMSASILPPRSRFNWGSVIVQT